MNFQSLLAAWHALPSRTRLGAIAGTCALALVLVGWVATRGRPCGERGDVEARVAVISASLQADAASGKIAVSKLAERIKTLNAAATAYETSKDLGAYCKALDQMSEDFKGPL